MQAKRYARFSEGTVAAGAATSIGEIDNTQTRRANWHGIRFWCRLRADNVSADNEAHGIIALYVKPSSEFADLSESNFDSDTNLQNLSEVILAICPWSVFGGSTNPVGAGTFQDIECIPMTSRTVARGAILKALCINYTESAKSIIVSHSLLNCFETVI